MSKLNNSLYSSDDHTWQTPPEIYRPLLDFLGTDHFQVDVCTSSAKNIPAAAHITPEGIIGVFDGEKVGFPDHNLTVCLSGDGLNTQWPDEGYCWMNPPYGTALKTWLKKAYEESLKGAKVWALVPARTETNYQHEYGLSKAGLIIFLSGRICFHKNGQPHAIINKKTGKAEAGNAPFPTMLLYYGDNAQELYNRWIASPPLPGTAFLNLRYQDGISKFRERKGQ